MFVAKRVAPPGAGCWYQHSGTLIRQRVRVLYESNETPNRNRGETGRDTIIAIEIFSPAGTFH